MYIASTKSLNDAKDDVLRIPFWGNSRNIQRYQDARDALLEHPEVKHITGHSLGGSVALQLQKDYNHIDSTRTFGAPVFDITPHMGATTATNDRYRNYGDPFSAFDSNANSSVDFSGLNPFVNHNYTHLGQDFTTTKTVPIESTNPDGSKSIIA